MAEKINKEIKKRTKVVSIFPNNASCLRLVSAILIEIDEEWRHGRKFLNMTENKTESKIMNQNLQKKCCLAAS